MTRQWFNPLNGNRTRRGGMLLEACVAVGLLAFTVAMLAELSIVASRQKQAVDRRQTALQELSNAMERALSRSWEDTVTDKMVSLELTEIGRSQLPEAQLSVTVDEMSEPIPAKRIHLRLRWIDSSGQLLKPVSLSFWKYRDMEQEQ